MPITEENIPTQNRPLTRRDSTANNLTPKAIPTVFYSATKDDKTGAVYLKIVNTIGQTQPIEINLKGATKVSPSCNINGG